MEPGTPVDVVMTKWGDRPHWQYSGIVLGRDDAGTWLGFPRGTPHARPGYEFVSSVDAVTLVPDEGWFFATLHAPGIWCDVYVDMTTVATWSGTTVTAVDLDLDVIQMAASLDDMTMPPGVTHGPGEVFVDDEDEFAEHRELFGYPAAVISSAEASCRAIVAAVESGAAPFDGRHLLWLQRLSDLTAT